MIERKSKVEKSNNLLNRRSFFKKASLFSAGTLLSNEFIEASSRQDVHGFYENNILKRTLGRTGLKVSAIGLGTIPLFRAPRQQAISVINKSYELGINYIDTARAYRDGLSEKYIGEAVKDKRDKFVIVSKSKDFTKKTSEHIDQSLKALQTDYIDVYCFHELCQEKEWETVIGPNGAMEAYKKAQRDGKIRFIGISGHRSDQLTEIIKSGDIDVVIIPFNFVFEDALYDLCPTAKKMNVGLAAIKPFAGCFLNQHELSLRWILEQHFDVAVPGMWQIDEVIQNTRVMRDFIPLTETEKEYLQEERQFWYYELCRFCYQCKKCPQGVPYRSIFMLPLGLRRQGFYIVLDERKGKYKYLNELDKIDNCNNCGVCVETCKYHIPIPDIIKDVRRIYYNVIKYYKV